MRPVSVESARLQEAITLLEEEVVLDQLLPVVFTQLIERVISSSEVSREVCEGVRHLFLNVESLSISDLGTQGESFQVSAHSDSGAYDHLRVIFVEGRGVQSVSTHISFTSMLFDSMIGFYDLIKEVSKGDIRVM